MGYSKDINITTYIYRYVDIDMYIYIHIYILHGCCKSYYMGYANGYYEGFKA